MSDVIMFYIVLVVFLLGLYLTVSRCWRDAGRTPSVHYREDSRLCRDIVRSCKTLTDKYVCSPTSQYSELWAVGCSGIVLDRKSLSQHLAFQSLHNRVQQKFSIVIG